MIAEGGRSGNPCGWGGEECAHAREETERNPLPRPRTRPLRGRVDPRPRGFAPALLQMLLHVSPQALLELGARVREVAGHLVAIDLRALLLGLDAHHDARA